MSPPARQPLSQKPPPRRRRYQQTRSGIPPTQRQWRKRDYESLKPRPPEPKGIPQSLSLEGYHSSTNPTLGCTAPPQDFHWSTFSFSESRTAFSFVSKRKSGFGPRRAGKNQLQDKNIPLSRKRKSSFTRKMHPPAVRRQSRTTSTHPFRKPPTQAAWIPTDRERYSTHSTAVAQKDPRVAQTHAAGTKRDTPRSLTRGIP